MLLQDFRHRENETSTETSGKRGDWARLLNFTSGDIDGSYVEKEEEEEEGVDTRPRHD